jgi:hypothetical protein
MSLHAADNARKCQMVTKIVLFGRPRFQEAVRSDLFMKLTTRLMEDLEIATPKVYIMAH